MSHVFISYSHEDQDFVEELMQRLEDKGFSIWTDTHIQTGQSWRWEIDNAIRTAFTVIVVMTPDAKDSQYVTYEWAYAYGFGVPVITVMLQKTELHPRLEEWQYLDGEKIDSDFWDRLFSDLEHVHGSYKPKAEVQLEEELPSFVRSALADLEDAETRVEIDAALNSLSVNHRGARKRMIKLLDHENKLIRNQVAFKLAEVTQYQDTSIVPYLERVVSHGDKEEVFQATRALVRIGSSQSALTIIDKSLKVFSDQRKRLLEEVSKLGSEVIEILVRKIEDTENGDLVIALAHFGAVTVPNRRELLQHRNPDIQRSAAISFIKAPDKRVSNQLQVVLRKREFPDALEALVETLGKDAKDDIVWALHRHSSNNYLGWQAVRFARQQKLTDEIVSELFEDFQKATNDKEKFAPADVIGFIFHEWERLEGNFTEDPKFTPVLLEAWQETSSWLKQNQK